MKCLSALSQNEGPLSRSRSIPKRIVMHDRLASGLSARALCGAIFCAPFVLAFMAMPVAAQEGAPTQVSTSEAEPDAQRPAGDVIDILVPVPTTPYDPGAEAQCEREQDAASIAQEIVVCARRRDDSRFRTSSDSRKRYAEETAFINDPQAPDVAGAGIFRGPATISGLCFIPPCPPPKAIIIDVGALPQAPVGSDADRIARGLPPLGDANPVGDAIVIPTDEAEAAKVAKPASTGPIIEYTAPSMDEDTVP